MSNTIKVGDEVRATYGNSVIVGKVARFDAGGITVSVEGTDGHRHWLSTSVWTVEVIAPPIPDVVGTIVRDVAGDAWQRCEDGWHATNADHDVYDLKYLHDDYGPLEVLWTPAQ